MHLQSCVHFYCLVEISIPGYLKVLLDMFWGGGWWGWEGGRDRRGVGGVGEGGLYNPVSIEGGVYRGGAGGHGAKGKRRLIGIALF